MKEYINKTHICPECGGGIRVGHKLPFNVYWRVEKKELLHRRCYHPRVLREVFGKFDKIRLAAEKVDANW